MRKLTRVTSIIAILLIVGAHQGTVIELERVPPLVTINSISIVIENAPIAVVYILAAAL